MSLPFTLSSSNKQPQDLFRWESSLSDLHIPSEGKNRYWKEGELQFEWWGFCAALYAGQSSGTSIFCYYKREI